MNLIYAENQLSGILALAADAPPFPPFSFPQVKKSGKPRWPSLLTDASLRELVGDCSGASELQDKRKTCVGYYLAE